MNKEEFLKAIENVPKTDSINSISSYNSINIEDLANAVNRFKKVATYDELLKENQKLKEKYENAVADYETTMSELQELKKQVEEYQEELEKADSITQSCIFNGKKESEISYRKCLNMLEKHKNQQKEFISYLENEIKSSLALDTINKQTAMHIYSTTLRKYKSIIGDDK